MQRWLNDNQIKNDTFSYFWNANFFLSNVMKLVFSQMSQNFCLLSNVIEFVSFMRVV